MTEHLDLDDLADLLAGEGSGEAHVETCPDCAGRLDELAAAEVEVAASLALLPPPELPDGLADRIAAALAAEPPQEAAPGSRRVAAGSLPLAGAQGGAATPRAAGAAAPASPATRTATVTPMARRRRRGSPAWLPAVAAGVVLVCGAGLGYALLGDDGDGDAQTTAGSAAESSRDSAVTAGPARNDSGVDYADTAAVTAALPAVLAGEADAGGPPPGPAAGAPSSLVTDPLAPLREPAGLASCLVALLPPEEPDVRPLALDYASYEGAPALAVVLPDPDPAKVAVYVVGPGCSQSADSIVFFTRLPRP